MPAFDCTVAMTSPPLISFVAALFVRLKGGVLSLWILDLNPDEAIAAGWMKPESVAARVLTFALRYGLRHAATIVALDTYMKERICAKGIDAEKVTVIAPWSHNDAVKYDRPGREKFRREHQISSRFVVMYSGNHSPCHPLEPLLKAACLLRNDDRIMFCFVGGGSEFETVKAYASAHRLDNILCLPYQAREALSGSLSAADLHVVVMGASFVGIVHPCKIYNILSLGIPVLYIGPSKSHASDLLDRAAFRPWAHLVPHPDPEAVALKIQAASKTALGGEVADAMQLSGSFSQEALIPEMMEVLEVGALHKKGCVGVQGHARATSSQGEHEHV
jgi:colanic acid biosynthesis glycosyl transferase WcaI